jgi:hypothetical protein
MPNFLNLFWSTKEVPKNNPIPLYQTLAPLKEEFMSVPQRNMPLRLACFVDLMKLGGLTSL